MNLVIDQGNTSCKLAFFDEGQEPADLRICEELSVPYLKELVEGFKPSAGILSSVKILNPEILIFLNEAIPDFILLNSSTPLPIANAYLTPQTLGLDRLAAAVGAYTLQPGKPLFVVDAGTAITYDLIASDGTFLGGSIAPGLQMRFKALNIFTDKLPLVKPVSSFKNMGTDTQSAIMAGVMQGIVYEMDGYLRDYQQRHENLFAFLTGGDLIYFDGKLKNGIFACKNLVLIGLNRILHYNVHS